MTDKPLFDYEEPIDLSSILGTEEMTDSQPVIDISIRYYGDMVCKLEIRLGGELLVDSHPIDITSALRVAHEETEDLLRNMMNLNHKDKQLHNLENLKKILGDQKGYGEPFIPPTTRTDRVYMDKSNIKEIDRDSE